MSYHLDASGEVEKCSNNGGSCPFKGEHYDDFETASIASVARTLKVSVEDLPTAVEPQPTDSWTQGSIRIAKLPTGIKVDSHRAVLPAGRYFVGDPCYTAGKDRTVWNEWVGEAYKDTGDRVIGASYNDIPIVACPTMYGDGFYSDDDGNSYTVSAGIIGAVDERIIREMGLDESGFIENGIWLDCVVPTILEFEDEEGRINFGTVSIATGDDDEDY